VSADPVWIGRADDGAVTCVVADISILSEAELLTPTAATPRLARFDSGPLLEFLAAELSRIPGDGWGLPDLAGRHDRPSRIGPGDRSHSGSAQGRP